jgi:Domain of unknown function (DUF4189)
MSSLRRHVACGIAAASLIVMTINAVQAAGALAVGVCGAYGYGFDFHNDTAARAAALKKCTGGACKIVGDVRKGCVAMAIDAKHPCGSFGWAIESHLGKAENMSVKRCYEFGGRECVVRAWACDEKG